MAFKDLQEHLEETFGQYSYQSYEVLDAAGEKYRTRKQAYMRGYDQRLTKQQKSRRLERKREYRAELRGDAPKKAWKLTAEQKTWAVTCGLPVRAIARALGVAPASIRQIRKQAGLAPMGQKSTAKSREEKAVGRRASRKARRETLRGGKAKPSWNLTEEQKDWACKCGLSLREAAKVLGITHTGVAHIRKARQPMGGAPTIVGGKPPAPAIAGSIPGGTAPGGGAI